MRPYLAACDIERLAQQGESRRLEERQVDVDRNDVGEDQLQELEPRLGPSLVGLLLHHLFELRVSEGSPVEAPESAERIATVDDSVEER